MKLTAYLYFVIFYLGFIGCYSPVENSLLEVDKTTTTKVTTVDTADLSRAIERGFAYLEKTQLADGSWEYLSFNERTATTIRTKGHPRIFTTMKILIALKNTQFEDTEVFKKGIQYILNTKNEEEHLWSWDGKQHQYSYDKRYQKYYHLDASRPLFIDPDVDDTALGLMLTGEYLNLQMTDYDRIKKLYDKYELKGMYRTFMDGYYEDRSWKSMYGYGNLPELGVNMNVLTFFEKSGLDGKVLATRIRQILQQEKYWEKQDHYAYLGVLALMASDNVEMGSKIQEEFMKIFVKDMEEEFNFNNLKKLNNLALAGYVKAKSHLYFLEELNERQFLLSKKLTYSVMELYKRQYEAGNWRVAIMFEAADEKNSKIGNLDYYGTSPETTAMVIKALWMYEKLINRHNLL